MKGKVLILAFLVILSQFSSWNPLNLNSSDAWQFKLSFFAIVFLVFLCLNILGLLLFYLKKKVGFVTLLSLTAITLAYNAWQLFFSFFLIGQPGQYATSKTFEILAMHYATPLILNILILIILFKSKSMFFGTEKTSAEISV